MISNNISLSLSCAPFTQAKVDSNIEIDDIEINDIENQTKSENKTEKKSKTDYTNLIKQCEKLKLEEDKAIRARIYFDHKDEFYHKCGNPSLFLFTKYLTLEEAETIITKLIHYFKTTEYFSEIFSGVSGERLYPKTERKIAEILLHIFFSRKGRHRECIALCDSFLQTLPSTVRTVMRRLKNNTKFIFRMRDDRVGLAEHIILNSIVENVIKFIIDETKDQYKKMRKLSIKPDYKIILEQFIKESAEERTKRLDLAENMKTIKSVNEIEIREINDLSTNRLCYRKYRFDKSHRYSIMKNGRYIMGDNSTNKKKEVKFLAYASLFEEPLHNYDLKDAHPTLLAKLLSDYIERYSDIGKYVNRARGLKCNLDTYLRLGKEYYINKTGIPKDVFKTMLYLTFNGGKVENKYSSKMLELSIKHGVEKVKSFIEEFKKLSLIKSIKRNLLPIISDFHRLNEEAGIEFCNRFNNHRDIEKGLKRGQVLSYYLSGYEASFITRCIEWCQKSGVKVISYEYDGLVTDKDLTKPFGDINHPLESMIEWAGNESGVGRVSLEPKAFM